MLLTTNIRMAVNNLRTSKGRSLLTMLGIIIGVVSVVTMISIGEGVKQQVVKQLNHGDTHLITLRPGHVVQRDATGNITGVDLLSAFGGAGFTQSDLDVVKKTPQVASATPFSIVNGIPQVDGQSFDSGFVLATSDDAGRSLGLKVAYGAFFSDSDTVKDGAVIGEHVAEQLFQENVPIGKTFTIRNQTFRVRGILDNVPASPLMPYSDYNDAVLIPLEAGKQLAGGAVSLYQIVVAPTANNQDAAARNVTERLKQAHAEQQDFTVLKGNEAFAPASSMLRLMTAFVTGIAIVSLVVGGIGIMNIMLVSVTERTREIGIRKAVGATNRQILMQFLIEATVMSVGGGVIGVLLSFAINYFLRVFTPLQPAISWPIIGIASGVAMLVGIFFGIAPAVQAARKDPIEALRYI